MTTPRLWYPEPEPPRRGEDVTPVELSAWAKRAREAMERRMQEWDAAQPEPPAASEETR